MTINNIEKAFIIADNAKYRGDYATANACFAYILGENPRGLKFGYEYSPLDENGEGEGVPTTLSSHDDIGCCQYHGLPVLYYGKYNLCIPAPLLTLYHYNKMVKRVNSKKEGKGCIERNDHARADANIDTLRPSQLVDLDNIHNYIHGFYVPSDVFVGNPIAYQNPNRTLRVGRVPELVPKPIKKSQLFCIFGYFIITKKEGTVTSVPRPIVAKTAKSFFEMRKSGYEYSQYCDDVQQANETAFKVYCVDVTSSPSHPLLSLFNAVRVELSGKPHTCKRNHSLPKRFNAVMNNQ